MKEKWLSDRLCSFDEKTRIELGPQLIELECNTENLRNEVTSAHYQIGKRDALGRIIMPERSSHSKRDDPYGYVSEGEVMTCVDWECKHKPEIWKVYKNEESSGDITGGFIKVNEFLDKQEALDFARNLAGEM